MIRFLTRTLSRATIPAARRRLAAALVVPTLLLAPAAPALLAQQVGVAATAERAHVYPGAEWVRWASPAEAGYSAAALDSVTAFTSTLNTTAAMAVAGGRVLWSYGPVDTVSYLASVRKSILAMMYGNYVADGTVDLERTLEDLGMDDIQGLLSNERRATVRHLATARSGIYHPASNSGDNSAQAPPRGSQEPGTYMLYNNWDFNAAGAAFERMTGRDIFDALESDIARPLGFQDFDRSIHRKSGDLERSRYPAYHMNLSTRDMARVGYLMLREGSWDGTQVIPRDWAREIVRAVTPLEEMNPPGRRDGDFGYGYMWWVWDGPANTGAFEGAYTGMGAYGQYITVLPKLDLVVAHKSAPPSRTSWTDVLAIIEGIVAARCDGGGC